MFTSGSLIRTCFTVNGEDFCVDTTIVLQKNGMFTFSTMFFRMEKDEVGFDESFDELTALTFDEARQNHVRMVKRYTVPFHVTPNKDDLSGIDRVLKELKEFIRDGANKILADHT